MGRERPPRPPPRAARLAVRRKLRRRRARPFYSETSSAELALLRLVVTLACVWTAAEAVSSDLLSTAVHLNRFFCGNFGMLLLQQASAGKVDGFLRRMLKITMMRGAQSAGVVTYQCVDSSSQTNRVGKRFRVVNGKRTDLSEKLLDRATGILQAHKDQSAADLPGAYALRDVVDRRPLGHAPASVDEAQPPALLA